MEGKGFSSYNDYLETKAKAYKAEQHNRKSINNLKSFSSALLERATELFKPITNKLENNKVDNIAPN